MSNQQAYRDVLSRLEKKDKQPMTSKEVYDALSFLPGTGDVIGAYEAPAIISAGIEKMGEDDLVEKAKGVGIASLGAIGVLPVVGGPARKLAKVFSKIDTPVYHFTLKPGFTKFDKSKQAFYDFGPHVASTPKGAQDRFVNQIGGVTSKDGELIFKTDSDLKGGSIPLKADLSKPFYNPKTGKPFTEEELNIFKASEIDKILKKEGFKDTFTTEDLFLNTLDGSSGQKDFFRAIDNTSDIRELINEISQNLAKEGFTHVPYVNAFEDKGQLSFEMLVDRPKGSTKVLQSPFAKKDPAAADDADFMKADGGVGEMKDKAVNMYRGKQGIEPFIKYMV